MRSFLTHASLVLLFAALSVALTFPLARDAGTAFYGPLDAWLCIYIHNFVLEALVGGVAGNPLHGMVFYPAAYTLGFSETMVSNQLFWAPLRAFFQNPVLCYNLLILASLVANALAMFAFLRSRRLAVGACVIGATIYGFSGALIAYTVHLQLITLWWTPLAFRSFYKFLESKRLSDLVWAGSFFVLQFAASVYLGVFLIVGLLLVFALRRGWNQLITLLRACPLKTSGALLLLGVTLGAVAAPQLITSKHYGVKRTAEDNVAYAAAPENFFSPLYQNWLYGSREWFARQRNPESGWEKNIFVGFLPMVLSVGVGFAYLSRRFRSRNGDVAQLVRDMMVIALLSAVFCLGPSLVLDGKDSGYKLPYALLLQYLTPFQALRVTARWILLALFGCATLSACAVHLAIRRLESGAVTPETGTAFRRQGLVGALLTLIMCLTVAEQVNTPLPVSLAEVTADDWALTTALKDEGRIKATQNAVMFWPDGRFTSSSFADWVTALSTTAKRMTLATYFRRPIANGYGGYEPPSFEKLMTSVRDANPEARARLLEDAGFSAFVVDRTLNYPNWPSTAPAGWRTTFENEFYTVYQK